MADFERAQPVFAVSTGLLRSRTGLQGKYSLVSRAAHRPDRVLFDRNLRGGFHRRRASFLRITVRIFCCMSTDI